MFDFIIMAQYNIDVPEITLLFKAGNNFALEIGNNPIVQLIDRITIRLDQ